MKEYFTGRICFYLYSLYFHAYEICLFRKIDNFLNDRKVKKLRNIIENFDKSLKKIELATHDYKNLYKVKNQKEVKKLYFMLKQIFKTYFVPVAKKHYKNLKFFSSFKDLSIQIVIAIILRMTL